MLLWYQKPLFKMTDACKYFYVSEQDAPRAGSRFLVAFPSTNRLVTATVFTSESLLIYFKSYLSGKQFPYVSTGLPLPP